MGRMMGRTCLASQRCHPKRGVSACIEWVWLEGARRRVAPGCSDSVCVLNTADAVGGGYQETHTWGLCCRCCQVCFLKHRLTRCPIGQSRRKQRRGCDQIKRVLCKTQLYNKHWPAFWFCSHLALQYKLSVCSSPVMAITGRAAGCGQCHLLLCPGCPQVGPTRQMLKPALHFTTSSAFWGTCAQKQLVTRCTWHFSLCL